jgi:hypothetical integral membrane protein (TIGR02206 family)
VSERDAYFHLLGPAHLAILAAVPAAAALLAIWAKRRGSIACQIRLALGCFLLVNELVWYAYRLRLEGFRFPEGLPLHLCDLTLWLAVIAALTGRQTPFELNYYFGLAGSSMALVTPDIWEQFPSYPTVYFFLAHGGVIVTPLYVIWAKLARPRRRSFWLAFGCLNAYAVMVGAFNMAFHTNYMYLCEKPAAGSLLDFLGPWPWYLAAGEALGFALFALLGWPFRSAPTSTSS